MCSLNSIVQLLRHIPEFLSQLNDWKNTSGIVDSLLNILSKQGSQFPVSALALRQQLAITTGNDLNSGAQQDTVELLGYLLNYCPHDLFLFETLSEYRFRVNGQASPCPNCHQFPPSVACEDTILRLAIPNSWTSKNSTLTLQTLLNRHFAVQQQENRTCSSCNESSPFMERLRVSKHPDYAIIQILRMGFVKSKTIKNPIAVHLPTVVTLDRISYEIVGTITHLGSPDAGHNRAYQKKGSSWYVFEDAK